MIRILGGGYAFMKESVCAPNRSIIRLRYKPTITIQVLSIMAGKEYTYLALGDSYTIGEAVDNDMNFPSQTAEIMRSAGHRFANPNIIATTGWTTDELKKAIESKDLQIRFDFVSLLIGVNNQYRGYDLNVYRKEFRDLLENAIDFSGNHPDHVFVLSIPDWGFTPFANGRNREQISREIDSYNAINKAIAAELTCVYIDITPLTREVPNNPNLITSDGLHPSARAYTEWAKELSQKMQQVLKFSGRE